MKRRELITAGWIRTHFQIPRELSLIIQAFTQNVVHWLMDGETFRDRFEVRNIQFNYKNINRNESITKQLIIEGVKFRLVMYTKRWRELYFGLQIVAISVLPNTMGMEVAVSAKGNISEAIINNYHLSYDCKKKHIKSIHIDDNIQHIEADDDKYLFRLTARDGIILEIL